MTYVVEYVAGSYSGTREVTAEDEEQALAIVRQRIRREMTFPMYSDSYKIIETKED